MTGLVISRGYMEHIINVCIRIPFDALTLGEDRKYHTRVVRSQNYYYYWI